MSDSPPHPKRRHPSPKPRQEPLPDTWPKPREDEPAAPERSRQLLKSPSYVRADLDSQLLQRDELRPSRLQLEYLKVELGLADNGVESTIVVFGGTRIVEPAAARRKLAEAERLLAEHPDDPACQRRLDVSRRVLAKSHYYDVARELGRIVSSACQPAGDAEFVIMTGGGPGIMEAANRGAYDTGAKNAGLNITLPHEQFPNPYITPELCFQFRYFALRKLHFLLRAKALVAFPGGYGTLDELFETLCLLQTRTTAPLPVVLVGREFWGQVWNPEFLADEGVINDEDLELFQFAETAEEIWQLIVDWWARAGEQITC